MIFKILLSRSVQTPNSDKNWQTSCPLQTFVCNISRHLEFIIEQGHRVNWVSGSLDSRITASLGHKMWPSSMSDMHSKKCAASVCRRTVKCESAVGNLAEQTGQFSARRIDVTCREFFTPRLRPASRRVPFVLCTTTGRRTTIGPCLINWQPRSSSQTLDSVA